MSNPTDAAIRAIHDRLAPSDAPTVGPSPMNDYETDPVTRNDLLQDLNNWVVDDPDIIYSELAEEAGAEDTPEFRKGVDDELAKERGDFSSYDRGDDPGRESDLDQGSYSPAEWYGNAQQAADDEGIYWWDNAAVPADRDEDVL